MNAVDQYLIELDGSIFRASGNTLEPFGSLKEASGDLWLVTDLQDAIPKKMIVEANVKYSELMVRKKLQETGEFDEPASVVAHKKKAMGRNRTDISFTALPARLSNMYMEMNHDYPDSMLVFPLFSILFHVLRKTAKTGTAALAFHHGRFVDMIIGSGKKVYYFDRCTAFDTSQEQTTALWNTVKSDILATAKENSVEISGLYYLNWIDSRIPDDWAEDGPCVLIPMENEEILFEGEKRETSFMKEVRGASTWNSMSPPLEKAAFFAKQAVVALCVILSLGCIVSAGAYFAYRQKNNFLRKTISAMETEKTALLRSGEEAPDITGFKKILDFAGDLDYCRRAPDFRAIVDDISAAVSPGFDMKIKELHLEYSRNGVQVEMAGEIASPFSKAHNGYKNLVSSLRTKGYMVDESKFDTKISTSVFSLKLNKGIL